MISAIQWILDATQFFKELGPLVSEVGTLLTLIIVTCGLIMSTLNRVAINSKHKENAAKLEVIRDQTNGLTHSVVNLAHETAKTANAVVEQRTVETLAKIVNPPERSNP